jgi:hypothetical protein
VRGVAARDPRALSPRASETRRLGRSFRAGETSAGASGRGRGRRNLQRAGSERRRGQADAGDRARRRHGAARGRSERGERVAGRPPAPCGRAGPVRSPADRCPARGRAKATRCPPPPPLINFAVSLMAVKLGLEGKRARARRRGCCLCCPAQNSVFPRKEKSEPPGRWWELKSSFPLGEPGEDAMRREGDNWRREGNGNYREERAPEPLLGATAAPRGAPGGRGPGRAETSRARPACAPQPSGQLLVTCSAGFTSVFLAGEMKRKPVLESGSLKWSRRLL